MGQYTIKDVQNRAELLKEATDNIYRAIHTKTGESPETLDQVPGCIMNIGGTFIVPSDMSFGYSNFTEIPSYLDFRNMESMYYTFANCSNLTTIPLIGIPKVTSMDHTFSGCPNLTTIPQLVTTNVQNMSGLFQNCRSLTEVPLLDLSNVWDMGSMFYGCESLTSIPQLVTTNVSDMSHTFAYCSSLTNIPQLVTTNVSNMSHMFEGCYSLTTIPQLDMTNVRHLYYTFYSCGSLTSIPQLNTSKVRDMSGVFSDCYALTTVEGIDFSGMMEEITHLFGYSKEMPNLTRFIVNGKIDNSISDEYSIKALTAIDYDSVKSILTAAANTSYDYEKTLAFNRTMTDQNGELAALVASCAGKGWTITGLTLQ